MKLYLGIKSFSSGCIDGIEMRILLFGKNGQVGWELQRSLALLGEVLALGRSDYFPCGDLSNLKGIADTIQRFRPDVIVNAAAYTAVDKAEQEQDLSWLINVRAVEVMAIESKKLGALLIHYSSDYVFSGDGSSWQKEEDIAAPINHYGLAKLASEEVITKFNPKSLIFRTSWVHSSRGANFIKTILNIAKSKKEISVVDDQFGSPTSAELIADCTAHVIRKVLPDNNHYGIYHLVSSGYTTWFDYAQFIMNHIDSANYLLNKINNITSSEYNMLARRPLNSRLNNRKFQEQFNLLLPDWQFGVKRTLSEIEKACKEGK
uniref:dTDP-4-dehydrorhamnose reductase n=3 Tax=Enterobacteriaceae TaxID=543 RepID=A0A2Z4BXB7_CITBR|nr:dTDP-4-dehydrorhamnose reductase [Citrobacter werkmanii]AWU66702.1 dTDP-4-dehydrorhamnose reductase [Citrobacter braakii]